MNGFVNTISIENNTIRVIEFYHPKSNSLPSILLKKIEQEIYDAGKDNLVKAILIKSSGEKSFCAGASFDELLNIKGEEDGEEFFNGFARVINAIRTVSKLVIGEVQGKAVGGGVGLACSFDYCFATTASSIKLSELSIGIGPFVIAPAVKRKIGISAFSELSIDAENWRNANWAKEKGMYYNVSETIEEMKHQSSILLGSICNYSNESIAEMKSLLWKGSENWEELLRENAKISGRLVLSEFTKRKLKEFKIR